MPSAPRPNIPTTWPHAEEHRRLLAEALEWIISEIEALEARVEALENP